MLCVRLDIVGTERSDHTGDWARLQASREVAERRWVAPEAVVGDAVDLSGLTLATERGCKEKSPRRKGASCEESGCRTGKRSVPSYKEVTRAGPCPSCSWEGECATSLVLESATVPQAIAAVLLSKVSRVLLISASASGGLLCFSLGRFSQLDSFRGVAFQIRVLIGLVNTSFWEKGLDLPVWDVTRFHCIFAHFLWEGNLICQVLPSRLTLEGSVPCHEGIYCLNYIFSCFSRLCFTPGGQGEAVLVACEGNCLTCGQNLNPYSFPKEQ